MDGEVESPELLEVAKLELALDELQQTEDSQKQRRREQGITYYIPNQAQLRGHQSRARTIAYVGANRSGKSTFGATEAVFHATGQYPSWFAPTRRLRVPNKGVITATEFPIIERVIEPKLMEFLPKDLLGKGKRTPQGYLSRLNLANGSTIDFLSSEMSDMAFESADWDWFWGDEPQKKSQYYAIRRGLLDRRGLTFLTFTPLTEPWMKEEIIDKQDGVRIDVVKVSLRDNLHDIDNHPILTEEAIQEFERSLPEEMRRTRVYGDFFHLRGVVYKEYASMIHEKTFSYQYPDPVLCVMDPHDRLPHWVIWAWIDRQDWLYIDQELVFQGELPDLKREILLTEAKSKYRVARRLIDPNFGRSPAIVGGRTVIEELAKAPYGMRFAEACDDRAAGHMKVRELLHWDHTKPLSLTNAPRLYFHKDRVRQTIRSVMNYQYSEWRGVGRDDRDPKEREKPKDTHGADCVRYLCMSHPTFERLSGAWRQEEALQEAVY